jgi:Uma2 family endonuclease
MAMVASDHTTTFTVQASFPAGWSLADLQERLGGIPLERIRLVPPPGCATEEDLLEIAAREDRLYELEDGILVEKPVGWYESLLAGLILTRINVFLETHSLGKALGADGSLNILPGLVKIPDVSFLRWERFPPASLRRRPIPALVPDLAVEVISKTKTAQEMQDKLEKYFRAGVRLVWYVYPETHTAKAFTSPTDLTAFDENGVLDGADVLPGFRMSLRELFERADREQPGEPAASA